VSEQELHAQSQTIAAHQLALGNCRHCPQMIGPVVMGAPVNSQIMSIGQAPGDREGPAGKPFAWTAGKTLFNWFSGIGVDERQYRAQVYMAAVCRCFPGKNPKGGDRVPSKQEISNCRYWLEQEFKLLEPRLIIPIGKLAIAQLLPVGKLSDVIGQMHSIELAGQSADVIPLPHPSGLSTWFKTEPGKTLLGQAMELIACHPAWQDNMSASALIKTQTNLLPDQNND
jgi:uracil-DNA glycosylase